MNNTISPEDMASFEVLHTQNHAPDSFSSGEYSFLPDVASGAIVNGDINPHLTENLDLTNMLSALGTSLPSTGEVHSQLLEISEENKLLKEKLNKNNAMMKEQLAIISDWREHMMTVKEQQQQNLLTAQEKISALEKENTKLTECLKQMESNKEKKLSSCEKCTLFDTTLNNMLAIDSFEDNESILLEMSDFREYLLPNLKKLCNYVETLSSGNIDPQDKRLIKTFVLLLKFKIAGLEGGNTNATVKTDEETGYEVVQRKPKENILQLRHDIELLDNALRSKHDELCCMKKEKEELCGKIRSYESKIEEYEKALKSRLEHTNDKSDIEESLSEKYKERCECLQQQLEEYQIKLEKSKMGDDYVVKELREDIQNLQDILKLEQEAKQDVKDRLNKVMLKCEKLQVDFDSVSKQLELESEKAKEVTALKENEAKDYLCKIDELTAQYFEMEEQKSECEAKVRRLEEELAKAVEDVDDIPVFKEQIELYEKDFVAIKDAHEKASVEAEQLKNELKKYEKKCNSCPCSCNSIGRQKNGKSSADATDQNGEVYECPICFSKFKKESDINRHMMRSHDVS